VIAGSLSKTYAMTGWRIGYVLGPKPVIDAIQKLRVTRRRIPIPHCAGRPRSSRDSPQESVAQMLGEYEKRRRFVIDRLRAMPGVQCAEPGGAFYAYPNISSSFSRGIRDSMDFSCGFWRRSRRCGSGALHSVTTDHIGFLTPHRWSNSIRDSLELANFMSRSSPRPDILPEHRPPALRGSTTSPSSDSSASSTPCSIPASYAWPSSSSSSTLSDARAFRLFYFNW